MIEAPAPTDWSALVREQEDRRNADLLARVKSSGPQLDSVEVTREYELEGAVAPEAFFTEEV